MCTVSARGGENSVRDWTTVVTQVRYNKFSKRYDVVYNFCQLSRIIQTSYATKCAFKKLLIIIAQSKDQTTYCLARCSGIVQLAVVCRLFSDFLTAA